MPLLGQQQWNGAEHVDIFERSVEGGRRAGAARGLHQENHRNCLCLWLKAMLQRDASVHYPAPLSSCGATVAETAPRKAIFNSLSSRLASDLPTPILSISCHAHLELLDLFLEVSLILLLLVLLCSGVHLIPDLVKEGHALVNLLQGSVDFR